MNAHTESAGDIHHKESNRDRELSPAHRYLPVAICAHPQPHLKMNFFPLTIHGTVRIS
jgi:hypothetical protein